MTYENVRRHLASAITVAAAISMIGLAPAASAKVAVLQRESCTGPDIVAGSCEKPPQPVPVHILSPHGSKLRKMAIAAERQAAKPACPPSSKDRD
ncbi:hypothetical protein [Mycobacterium aquaticum]|uniref:Haemophore haem-binding domain-containing protein n=1 Tax=Mycobacterium aquaticum TaxID=1927124 RepID=A0A1X0A329_9MYCO|nr:hypothetical protein [Mycobacterium aquaticum]ORA24402.1 hypothetical protein BST13_34255 [Mycobacterium aquaticum]